MPALSQLTLYPVKSCAGMSLRQAVLTTAGLTSGGVADREWMAVDAAGNFLTQRECPAMATIVPHLSPGILTLRAPCMPELCLALAQTPGPVMAVHLWEETVTAIDCGDAAAAWFSAALRVACRLVRYPLHGRRIASTRWTDGILAPTRFADGFPVLVIGQASLDDLNQKLQAQGRLRLPMNRFRPNIVIDGIAPFEEDHAASICIGDAILKPVKPCPRCPIPSVDQDTGIVGPDPLDILQSYRANRLLDGAITFGMNAIVLGGDGTFLRVGQECDITLAF